MINKILLSLLFALVVLKISATDGASPQTDSNTTNSSAVVDESQQDFNREIIGNCDEFRHALDASISRLEATEEDNKEQDRIDCEIDRRLDEHDRILKERGGEQNRPPQPVDELTPEPAPSLPPDFPLPPLTTDLVLSTTRPQLPSVPEWDGNIDFETSNRSEFCDYAKRVARCIDYHYLNGRIVHGDLYYTCQGRYVLFTHIPRTAQNFARVR